MEEWGARNPDESTEVTGDNPELGQVDGEDPISEVYDPEGSDEEGDALKVRTKAGHDGGARNGFVEGVVEKRMYRIYRRKPGMLWGWWLWIKSFEQG